VKDIEKVQGERERAMGKDNREGKGQWPVARVKVKEQCEGLE